MSSLTIKPARSLRGVIDMPGDKSVTHRAVLLAALAQGRSSIAGYCRGEDCLNTMRACRAMGVEIQEFPERLDVQGKGLWGLSEPNGPIDCGNSGTGIRLLTGLLAGQDFFAVLTGDASIRRRPMGRVVRPLREMGASIAGRRGGELAPLALTGAKLRGIAYTSPVASAQVKSALLLAGLFAEGATSVTEPRASRDHTERIFRYYGIACSQHGTTVSVEGCPATGWPAKDLHVPGDFSAASFFLVAATIVTGSHLTIRRVGVNPTRVGLLTILTRMGADIQVMNIAEEAGEPVADLVVRSAALKGVTVTAEEIPNMIDEFPVLCVAASVAEGDTIVTGAEELRVKESDRIATMAAELRKMGVSMTERPDGMVIHGGGEKARLTGACCESHGDHRIAMSMAVAGLVAEGATTIADSGCIETSFPGFESKLLDLLTPLS
ncbi:MAG: 3-phosphoshikimate 1-carboxyvinyltransferase [Nitrospiraceae bacterium]